MQDDGLEVGATPAEGRPRPVRGMRTLPADEARLLCFDGLDFDTQTRTVKRDGVGVKLSPREAVLLHAFLLRPNRPMAASELEKCVYGWEVRTSRSAIPELIRRLRKRLGRGIVRTLPGYGWIMGAADDAGGAIERGLAGRR